jgi:hypothetical protein
MSNPKTAGEAALVHGIFRDAKALFKGLERLHGSSCAQDADLHWALKKYLLEQEKRRAKKEKDDV